MLLQIVGVRLSKAAVWRLLWQHSSDVRQFTIDLIADAASGWAAAGFSVAAINEWLNVTDADSKLSELLDVNDASTLGALTIFYPSEHSTDHELVLGLEVAKANGAVINPIGADTLAGKIKTVAVELRKLGCNTTTPQPYIIHRDY